MFTKNDFFSVFSNYGVYDQEVQNKCYLLLQNMKSSPENLYLYYVFASEILREHADLLQSNNASFDINILKAMVMDLQRTIMEKNNYNDYGTFYDRLNSEGIIDELLRLSFMLQTTLKNELIILFSDLSAHILYLKLNYMKIDTKEHLNGIISFFNDHNNDIYHRIGVLRTITSLNNVTICTIDIKDFILKSRVSKEPT